VAAGSFHRTTPPFSPGEGLSDRLSPFLLTGFFGTACVIPPAFGLDPAALFLARMTPFLFRVFLWKVDGFPGFTQSWAAGLFRPLDGRVPPFPPAIVEECPPFFFPGLFR